MNNQSAFSFILSQLADQNWAVYRNLFEEAYLRRLLADLQRYPENTAVTAPAGKETPAGGAAQTPAGWSFPLQSDSLNSPQAFFRNTMKAFQLLFAQKFSLNCGGFEARFEVCPPGVPSENWPVIRGDEASEILCCILYLNFGWRSEDGGHLRIPGRGNAAERRSTDIIPGAGTFVCFRPARIQPVVLPGSRGSFHIIAGLKYLI